MGIIRSNAELVGDSKDIPNRGTGTGMNGDTYGADLSGDATNSMGNISGSTKSQPALDNCACAEDRI